VNSGTRVCVRARYINCWWRAVLNEEAAVSSSPAILTSLWEIADGTAALLVEHVQAPRWELRIVRNGQECGRFRCETIGDLMGRSLAEFTAAAGTSPLNATGVAGRRVVAGGR
jgi:hypothetical protein